MNVNVKPDWELITPGQQVDREVEFLASTVIHISGELHQVADHVFKAPFVSIGTLPLHIISEFHIDALE